MNAQTPRHAENLTKKRGDIRRSHRIIRRCSTGRRLAVLIVPTALMIGAVHDPVSAMIAGVWGVLLVVALRAWMTEVRWRKKGAIRRDRETRRILIGKLRNYRRHVEHVERAAVEKAERARMHQQEMQKAAQRRFEARRQSECGDKWAHATEESAVKHMGTLTAKPGKRLNVYRCEFCGHWHVGNSGRGAALMHRPFESFGKVAS